MTHRFPAWSFERVAAPLSPGFVPCPVGLVPPAYAAFVAEVYRQALERTREQLAAPAGVAAWEPAFSIN